VRFFLYNRFFIYSGSPTSFYPDIQTGLTPPRARARCLRRLPKRYDRNLLRRTFSSSLLSLCQSSAMPRQSFDSTHSHEYIATRRASLPPPYPPNPPPPYDPSACHVRSTTNSFTSDTTTRARSWMRSSTSQLSDVLRGSLELCQPSNHKPRPNKISRCWRDGEITYLDIYGMLKTLNGILSMRGIMGESRR